MKYLANEYSFIPLITAVRDLEKQEEDDEKLVEDLKNNLLYLKDLSKAVKEKRKRDDLEEKSRDELMYQLQVWPYIYAVPDEKLNNCTSPIVKKRIFLLV